MAVDYNRKVKIERYWANVFGKLREAQVIADSLNPEYDLLYEKIRDFINDCFIETARESVLARWEKIVGVVPLSTDTLEERRNRVLYLLQITLPYTERRLKKVFLAQIVGEGNYQVTVDPIISTIEVLINPAKQAQWNDVIQMLDTILPCNMELIVGNMGTPHSVMEEYSHDELGAFSHDQITNELMFINQQ